MPTFIPALVAAGATVGQAIGIAVFAFVANTVTYAAIAYGLNRAFAKKPKSPSFDSSGLQNTITIRNSAAPRQIVYGEVRTGGVLVFAETSGSAKEFLNLVIALAGHEVEAIDDIYFNDEVVPLSSNAATGTYAGVAWVYKHLGTASQTVDTDLQTAVGSGTWSNDHRLRGIAYLYVKLKFNSDKFPGGIPNVSAIVQGRKVLDTRDASTAYSTNWALVVRDYLTLSGLGLGVDAADIDTTECNAAANTSDEDVTLNPSGTEKRYTVNGIVDTSETPGEVLQKLASAGAGVVLYVGGKWIIRAGEYQTPTLTFDEDDFRGPISVQTKLSRREIFNGVKGLYVSAENQWQPSDFPPITDSTATTEDGGERIWRDIELPFTISNATAQRLAKIELKRARQQYVVRAPMKLTAIQCQVGDVVQLTNARFGWSSKAFEVVEFAFAPDTTGAAPALGVDLVLRETASSVWDWSDSEETPVDPAADTTLYDPLSVATPASFTALSDATTTFIQEDGSVVPRVLLSWTQSTDEMILSGGNVVLQYKPSAGSDWFDLVTTPGDAVEYYITGLQIGTDFDFRARFRNINRVRGDWATVDDHTVAGDTSAPAAPTGLTAVAGAGFVTLDWDDNTEADLGEYAIYRHTSNSFGGASKIAEAKASRFVDSISITPGTTYYYWIVAIDRSENESSASSSANAAPTAPINTSAPSTPSAVTYNTGGTYDAGDGGVFAYIVLNTPALPSGAIALDVLYRVNGSGSWIIADQMTASGTARIDDLTPGVTYQFSVRAISSGGAQSAVPTPISQAAPNKSGAPSTPTGLTATGTLESITLDWSDNTESDFAYYEIYRHTSDSSGSATKIANASVSYFVDTLPSASTTYYYWLKAVNRSGNASAFTSSVNATRNEQSGGGGGGYTLTVDWFPILGGGYVDGNYATNQSVVSSLPGGKWVTIEADASVSGNSFSQWSGPGISQLESSVTTNPNRILMGGNLSLTADY